MNYNTFRFDVAGLPRSSRKKLAWTGQDQRLRKALGANALAQMRHRRRIAKKIPKAHGLSLMHSYSDLSEGTNSVAFTLTSFDNTAG